MTPVFFITLWSGINCSPRNHFFENANQDILISTFLSTLFSSSPSLLIFDQKWEMNLIKTQIF